MTVAINIKQGGKTDQERTNRDAKSREEFDEKQDDFMALKFLSPHPLFPSRSWTASCLGNEHGHLR